MESKPGSHFAVSLVVLLLAAVGLNGNVVSATTPQTLITRPWASGNQGPALMFPQSIRAQVSQSGSTAATSYSGYTRITDASEVINLEVPVEWNDIDTGPWKYKDQKLGSFVAASGNLANFYATQAEPGVFIGVSHLSSNGYTRYGLLDLEQRRLSGQCAHRGRFDHRGLFYTGQYDHYTQCTTGAPNLLMLTTVSADQKLLILVRVVVVSDADLDAAATIFNTFQVLGDPEEDAHHDH